VNPMLIAAIFVVVMALPAFAAVKFSGKNQKQPAYAPLPARKFARSTEGSVVVPVRAQEAEAPLSLKALTRASKRQVVEFADGEVNAVIDRLILTVPAQGFKRLS
jgi:hypothetical protein